MKSSQARAHERDLRRAPLRRAEALAAALLSPLPEGRRHDPRPRPDLPVFSRIPLGPFVIPVQSTVDRTRLRELRGRAGSASWGEVAGDEPECPYARSYLYRYRGRSLAAIRVSLRAPALGARALPLAASLGLDLDRIFGQEATVLEASSILADPLRLVHVDDAIALLMRAVLANLELHEAEYLVLPLPEGHLGNLGDALGMQELDTGPSGERKLAVGRASQLRRRLAEALPAAEPTATEVVGLSV